MDVVQVRRIQGEKYERVYQLEGRARRKKLLDRLRHRLQDNINLNIRRFESVNRRHLTQDMVQWRAVADTETNLRLF